MKISRRVLGIISCVDDNKDELRIIEGVTSNTSILNFSATNVVYEDDGEKVIKTEILIDKKRAADVKTILEKFINS